MKIALVLALVAVVAAEKVRYDNFQVYRVTPKTQESLEALHTLEENPGGFSFWSGVSAVGRDVDILVPPHLKYQFQDVVQSLDLDSKVFIENVQELIDNENANVTKRDAASYDWTSYQTLDEINALLRSLAASNPNIVTVITGGTTNQGRDILGVRLRFRSGNERRAVFIEANIHAREWITSAVATYFLNELLNSNNANLRAVAESHDWYIFPVTNPDGFVYSHTTERLWRKTRTPYTSCAGADPNRNWDYYYNSGGTSSSTCSETYRGPRAFSETSTRTLSEFISTIGPNLRAYISLHSYSQLLLLPYGYTSSRLDNYNELRTVGLRAATSLAQRYGTSYTVGNIVETLYVASGGSMDWVKGTFGTRITYTYELRDTGRYGFILPANQIIPTAEETVDSIVTIFREFDAL